MDWWWFLEQDFVWLRVPDTLGYCFCMDLFQAFLVCWLAQAFIFPWEVMLNVLLEAAVQGVSHPSPRGFLLLDSLVGMARLMR